MESGKYKYITASGDDAFNSTFDLAYSFDLYGYAGVKQGSRTFYIDVHGSVVLEMDTSHNLTDFNLDGLGVVHEGVGGHFKYGVLSTKGEWFVPAKYECLGNRSCGLFCASRIKEDVVLDYNGQRLFSLGKFKYFDHRFFSCDKVVVRRGGKYYFWDKDGHVAQGPYYYCQLYCDGLAYVKYSEKTSPVFVDADGRVVVTTNKFEYTSEYFGYGVLEVQYKGEYGLVNRTGEFVVEPVYDRLESLANGCYVASEAGTRHVIRSTGAILMDMPLEFVCLWHAEEEVAAYQNGKRWGYLKLAGGTLITDAIYAKAGLMRHGRAPVLI
jgi:hypothetical protein